MWVFIFPCSLKVLHCSYNKRNSKYDEPFANNWQACVAMMQLTSNHSSVVEWMPNLHYYPMYKDTALNSPTLPLNRHIPLQLAGGWIKATLPLKRGKVVCFCVSCHMKGLLSLWMRGGMVGAGGKQQYSPATSVALQARRLVVPTDNSAGSHTQRQHRRTGNERNAWKINTASLSLFSSLLSSSQCFSCSAQWETMGRQLALASRHCRSIKGHSL